MKIIKTTWTSGLFFYFIAFFFCGILEVDYRFHYSLG